MKVYRLEIMIVDHDEVNPEEIKSILENARYPNRCISPYVMKMESREIGEWDDRMAINQLDHMEAEFIRMFSQPDPPIMPIYTIEGGLG